MHYVKDTLPLGETEGTTTTTMTSTEKEWLSATRFFGAGLLWMWKEGSSTQGVS